MWWWMRVQHVQHVCRGLEFVSHYRSAISAFNVTQDFLELSNNGYRVKVILYHLNIHNPPPSLFLSLYKC